ncbi:pilus assembly protein [Marinobacterium sp. D7]|uniref:TadE/TadG family type IV pilus assembly protein n=1 Tax=Marinobacterium ramblicola TaxID=2849041 RepID=UPI001C2D0ECA|nr:TadE/TadG family type IV pilus assembly protein [Marinobacterium ramblicola]MBV1786952.1 pilus assembly protein [Marinobacterium ramblicola]
MNRCKGSARRRQRGLAAVEMTLVLPVLLLLMLATAEIGRMLYQYNTLTKAQRNGVRLLATQLNYGQQSSLEDCPTLGGTLPDNLINRARNLIVYGAEGGGATPILDGLATANVGFCEVPALNEIQVHVEYDFTPMLFNSLPRFGSGADINIDFPLDSSVSMRVLGGS